jgi:hypothetical protein
MDALQICRDLQRKEEIVHTHKLVKESLTHDEMRVWNELQYTGRFAVTRDVGLELCKVAGVDKVEVIQQFAISHVSVDMQFGLSVELYSEGQTHKLDHIPALLAENLFVWLPSKPDFKWLRSAVIAKGRPTTMFSITYRCAHAPHLNRYGSTFLRSSLEA